MEVKECILKMNTLRHREPRAEHLIVETKCLDTIVDWISEK